MIRSMKNSRVSVVAAGATLALTATVLTIAPATAAQGGALEGQSFQASAGVHASALALGKRRTKLKVKTTANAVVVLQPAEVTGKVSGSKRKVMLQLKNAYGWKKVDKDKSNKKGEYALEVPTKWYGKKKMRVVVAPNRKFQGKVKKVAVKVTEGYDPAGNKKAWTRISSYKTRYNPCQTDQVRREPEHAARRRRRGAERGDLPDRARDRPEVQVLRCHQRHPVPHHSRQGAGQEGQPVRRLEQPGHRRRQPRWSACWPAAGSPRRSGSPSARPTS